MHRALSLIPRLFITLLLLTLPATVFASGHGGGEAAGPTPMSFVVNVGPLGMGSGGGMVQLNLVLQNAKPEAAHLVDEYKPMIQHHIMMVICTMSFDTLRSADGKDLLAEKIVERVNKVLGTNRKEGIAQAFFTSFILQAN